MRRGSNRSQLSDHLRCGRCVDGFTLAHGDRLVLYVLSECEHEGVSGNGLLN